MKKKIWLLLLSAALLCSGCGRKEGNSDEDGPGGASAPSGITESFQTLHTTADGQVPDWAQEVQYDKKLFQNLNLDGVGEADDEAYVSVYEFGDEYHTTGVFVLRVRLGTGEVFTEIFPCEFGMYYEFDTGRLFAEDKDAIILSKICGTCVGVNATNILVVRIWPDDPAIGSLEMWTILDTSAPPNGMTSDILNGSGLPWGLNKSGTLMVADPEVVDMEGSPLQGLKVTTYDPYNGLRNPDGSTTVWENVIYWKDGLWRDGNRAYWGK